MYTTVAPPKASVLPYWNEIKGLDKNEKIKLIALLSSSLVADKDEVSEKDRTQEMIDRFCGSWVGEQTAEEIIANINESKKSHSEPVTFCPSRT